MIIIQNSINAALPADGSKSLFAAELEAVGVLLASLDQTKVAVGIVTTAVEPSPPHTPISAAVATVVPLTNDYGAVRLGLERIRERGESGWSNWPASIDQCIVELSGLGGSISSSTGGGRRAIVLLANSVYPPSELFRQRDDEDPLKTAADRARVAGVPIYAYILAFMGSTKSLGELAQSTGGALTVVRSPAKLNEAVSQFSVPEN